VPGTCVTVTLEGRRPLVAEVQTLVYQVGTVEAARRVTSGLDPARAGMMVAVLRQRANIHLERSDIYAATVGGVRLSEPSVDLALALALASAKSGLALPADLVAFGEVGLAGEIRSVTGVARRLAEAGRMGFRRAIVPAGPEAIPPDCPVNVVGVADVSHAVAVALGADAMPG
jgi:DNA repair protein RadA/Sms